MALGNKIVAETKKETWLFKDYPGNRVYASNKHDESQAYFTMSGTSMAAPVIAGTAALMLQAHPSLSPNVVKAILGYAAQRMMWPGVLEQGNGYLNAEGAVRPAVAISQYSNSLFAGQQSFARPDQIKAHSNIGGEEIPWGAAILWGDGVLWGEGILWGEITTSSLKDASLILKQFAWSDGILWGEGSILSNSVFSGNGQVWRGRTFSRSIIRVTQNHWFLFLVDASSMTDSGGDSVLMFSDSTLSPRTGPLGAWFYPLA